MTDTDAEVNIGAEWLQALERAEIAEAEARASKTAL
jgi:hypothetical protein